MSRELSIFGPVLALAFLVSLLATPVMRRVAGKRDAFDFPDRHLHPHHRPIPRLGGVAILLGTLVGALASFAWGGPAHGKMLLLVLGVAGFIFILGLADDLGEVHRYLRLGGHLAAGMILALAGLRANILPWAWASIPLSVLYVAGAINALNLLDGLDGLAGGMAAIACVGFALISMLGGRQGLGLVLAAALLGGILGFLPYNFHPASIFMGDGGSTLLGLGLSALALEASAESTNLGAFLAGLMLLGLPILDTAVALGRRALHHRPLFLGDRSHLYDQLVDRGLSAKATVGICYILSLAFMLLGLSIAWVSDIIAGIVFLVVFAALVASVLKLGMLRA